MQLQTKGITIHPLISTILQLQKMLLHTLIENGHRKIAMISGTLEDPSNGFARYQGYKNALEKAGIPFNDDLVRIGNYRYESGIEVAQYFLELQDKPTAIFAANDEMAIGAIHAIQDKGLKSTRGCIDYKR